MLVADYNKDANSASLGAKETIAVGVTEDASFITMMFSNLYSNQTLAAVREPICNAWDAMIDAGLEDQCLDITLNRDTGDLAIRDYGKGIHAALIGKIYGTIGGSTKGKNIKATGGFGLGSKAPWALVDSFRVTSRHEGTMSVYNMAKATLETEGKPAITRVVDVPCDPADSGLTVEMRIPQEKIREAENYIQYAVAQGSIKARLNGNLMEVCDLSTEPGSYLTGGEKWFTSSFMPDDKIFVRYGTVVYPALRIPETEKALELLRDFMKIIDVRKILIQAAPGTLGLTPARESLSSGKLTADGITKLCLDLIANIEKGITERLPGILAQYETQLKAGRHTQKYHYEINSLKEGVPGVEGRYYRSGLGGGFRQQWESRLETAEHVGWKKVHKSAFKPKVFGLIKRERNARNFGRANTNDVGLSLHDIYQSFGSTPILKKIHRAGFNLKHVSFVPGAGYSCELLTTVDSGRKRNSWESSPCWKEHNGCNDLVKLAEQLNGSLVFVGSRSKPEKLIRAYPDRKTDRYTNLNSFYIHVDKEFPEEDRLAAIAKLEKLLGVSVVDTCIEQPWDPAVIERKEAERKKLARIEKAKATRAAKKAALLAAGLLPEKAKGQGKNYMASVSNFLGKSLLAFKDIKVEETTETPLFYVSDTELTGKFITNWWQTKWLTPDELKHGVVVLNQIQVNMAVKRGAVPAREYFAKKLIAIVHSAEFKKYFTKQRRKGIAANHRLSAQTIKMFEIFNIPLKGMEKLTHNVLFEEAMDLYKPNKTNLTKCSGLMDKNPMVSEEELLAPANYVLEELPFIKKLKALANDEIFTRLLDIDGYKEITLTQLLQRYPERKQALKSLALAAIKSGK